MKLLLIIVALSLALISCRSIDGEMQVDMSISANSNKKCGWNPFGHCDPNEKVNIPTGAYKATIYFGSTTELKIDLKANRFKETLVLTRPANFDLPSNGNFKLFSKDIDQDFDVEGTVQTTVSDSPIQYERESCTFVIRDWVCKNNGNQPVCNWENKTVWGYRYVQYLLRNTARNLNAVLEKPELILARFSGTRVDSEKIYLSTGQCN